MISLALDEVDATEVRSRPGRLTLRRSGAETHARQSRPSPRVLRGHSSSVPGRRVGGRRGGQALASCVRAGPSESCRKALVKTDAPRIRRRSPGDRRTRCRRGWFFVQPEAREGFLERRLVLLGDSVADAAADRSAPLSRSASADRVILGDAANRWGGAIQSGLGVDVLAGP
jgi:hypothetical protein